MVVGLDMDPTVVGEAARLVAVDDVDNVVEDEDAADDVVDADQVNIAVVDSVEIFVVVEVDEGIVALMLDVVAEDVVEFVGAVGLAAHDVAAGVTAPRLVMFAVDVAMDAVEGLLVIAAALVVDWNYQIERMNLGYQLFSFS